MSPGTPALVLSPELKVDTLITDGMVERFLELEPPMNAVISEFQDIINEIERAYVLGMFFSARRAPTAWLAPVVEVVIVATNLLAADPNVNRDS